MSKSDRKHDQTPPNESAKVSEATAAEVAADETEAAEPGAEEVAAIEAEPDPLAELAAERDEFKEKWLRVVAELDNVRKRTSRELLQSRRFAQADVLRSFLEIQDNFERALQSEAGDADTDHAKSFREGVELIYQRLRGLLKEKGVEPMEVLEQEFDPTFHDAVGQLPREGVEPGIVIEVVQQGYHFGDMVLRPARVIISA